MTKKYISLNSLQLLTTIMVEGIEAVVEFKGGRLSPQRRNGIFITDNPTLQEALESSSSFGKSYALYENGEVKEIVLSEQKPLSLQNIADITTKQKAIEWVNSRSDEKLTATSTIETIEKSANVLGFTFTNLKAKKRWNTTK